MTAFVCQLGNGNTFRRSNLSNVTLTLLHCVVRQENLLKINATGRNATIPSPFVFEISEVPSKSIDIFIAVAVEALTLKLVQSKIYHSLNVTF